MRVIHFEIDADEPERLVEFYGRVFRWKFNKWGPIDYWIIGTGEGPGIDGGLIKREKQGILHNTIDVPSVDELIKRIKKNGGEIVRPKMPIPGVGWLAAFKDPEGNVFGIMEEDKSAK